MKKTKHIVLLITIGFLVSCAGGTSKQPANSKGFSEIEKELRNKFGENAYYTNLSISYDESIGNMIDVTISKDPSKLKMEEWSAAQNTWNQSSEITLEVPEGSKASDFMFQLNEQINLTKLGELVEKSVKKLQTEKNIENPTLNMAFVKFPDNGDISKAEYTVMLKPKNGGTNFTFFYKLNGEFIKMDY